MLYAHSPNAAGDWHPLAQHLREVARLAGEFGDAFGAGGLCHLAGLLHDVGKADPAWQAYLRASDAGTYRGRKIDHKAAGASLARTWGNDAVAMLIQAHHGGLQSPAEFKQWFQEKSALGGMKAALAAVEHEIPELVAERRRSSPSGWPNERLAFEVLLRLAYSALVDADTLDTEGHRLAGAPSGRGSQLEIDHLLASFTTNYERRFSGAPPTAVNRVRREVYEAAMAAAVRPPGLFRLTVPTGGGKTLAGIAFALRHAAENGLQRVVSAVPFTTITEQTAKEYRDILAAGDGAVLEHHSAAIEATNEDDEDDDATAMWARLAAENWDAPIVVTTTVQLFESLFASRRNRMRKLHNLARSVIVIDEAQALPTGLLAPILDGLKRLVADAGATVVISTATQPAFDALPEFRGLDAVEIVPGHAAHFEALERVSYEWRTSARHEWNEVGEWLRGEGSALAIVNTVAHSRELYEALGDDEAIHLSTRLCGAHRRATLDRVRERLRDGQPCRVVSTQLVEAGVDLDFPAVYRALGPFDSIVQAAGRCNREGKLGRGRVVVFRPPDDSMPPGVYRTGAGLTEVVTATPGFSPSHPDAARVYSTLLYESASTDAKGIQRLRERWDFPRVAEAFRMIEDDQVDVIVPYGTTEERREVERIVERLRHRQAGSREDFRKLQPYIVQIRRREWDEARQQGFIDETVRDRVGWWVGRYDDERLGLLFENGPRVV